MKKLLLPFFYSTLVVTLLTGCYNSRRLVTDEVVFTDGTSQTGTIIKCDSATVKIKRMDESINIFPWSMIDTIQGKKLKTFFCGVDLGVYKTPYFSVFRNESMSPTSLGLQYKAGFALRGIKLYYLNLTVLPARPSITKFGLGYQYYMGQSKYTKKTAFFIGTEANLMGVKYNNGPQATFEPFTGFELRLAERIRIHTKLGLQFNMSNKNNQTGVNFTVGVHFLNRNFKRYYTTLNADHRMLRK